MFGAGDHRNVGRADAVWVEDVFDARWAYDTGRIDANGDGGVTVQEVDANGNGYLDCGPRTASLSPDEFIQVEDRLLVYGLITHRQSQLCPSQLRQALYLGDDQIMTLSRQNHSKAAGELLRTLSVQQLLRRRGERWLDPNRLSDLYAAGNVGAFRQLVRQARTDWDAVEKLDQLSRGGYPAAGHALRRMNVGRLLRLARNYKTDPRAYDSREMNGMSRALVCLRDYRNRAVVRAITLGEVALPEPSGGGYMGAM